MRVEVKKYVIRFDVAKYIVDFVVVVRGKIIKIVEGMFINMFGDIVVEV